MTKAFDPKERRVLVQLIDDSSVAGIEAAKEMVLNVMKRDIPPAYRDQLVWQVNKFKEGPARLVCEYPGRRRVHPVQGGGMR